MMSFTQNKQLDQMCQNILGLSEIRFCGVINKLGNLIAGGFKEGITPLEPDEKQRMMYIQMILDMNMRREHDDSLGPVEYTTSKREKILMISIPISDYVVLLSAEPHADPHQLVKVVKHHFASCKKEIPA